MDFNREKDNFKKNILPNIENENNVKILLAYVRGSHMYGTNLPTSDVDITFIYQQPTDEILRGNYKEQINYGGNDIVGYEIQRYIQLLSQNNPNILESLDIPNDCLIYKDKSMDIFNQKDWISKLTEKTILGYANSQIKKATGLNKMKNRIEKLKLLVNFNKDEFIVVRILQRKKDNPNLEYSVKQLKTYSFYSWEELESQIDRIKEICDMNNARAYIRLNKQNSVDVSLRCIAEISDNLRTGNSSKNKGVWDSVSGKGGSKDWWVLDLDSEHLHLKEKILEELSEEYKNRENTKLSKYIDDLNRELQAHGYSAELSKELMGYTPVENITKSGVHIICKPFDTRILDKYNKELSSKGIPTIQIQRDANTVLYIGNE